MGHKKTTHITIQEIYLVKADWERTFFASIRRDQDSKGDLIIYGKVTVLEGNIVALGCSEEDLGSKLDIICKLKLDYGLHNTAAVVVKISNVLFFMN